MGPSHSVSRSSERSQLLQTQGVMVPSCSWWWDSVPRGGLAAVPVPPWAPPDCGTGTPEQAEGTLSGLW